MSMPRNYERRIPLSLDTPCDQWPGVIRANGYGVVMIDGTEKYVHRLTYQLHVGPIPKGWEIDHVCHSEAVAWGECEGGPSCPHRACRNPEHLEAVSSRTNSERGNHPLFATARRATCQRGHDLTDEANVYVRPDGRVRCRVCQVEGARRRRAAR